MRFDKVIIKNNLVQLFAPRDICETL